MIKPDPFDQEMRAAICRVIANLPRHVVGIGETCLWGSVASELGRCRHAPKGTNAAWVAHEVYTRIVRDRPFDRFVYADDTYKPGGAS